MHLTCPYCGYSKTLNSDQLPHSVAKVTCPKCQQNFPFVPEDKSAPDTQPPVVTETPAQWAEQHPKAGFWLRLVAALIDMTIVLVLQLILGAALGFSAARLLPQDSFATINLLVLVEIFTYVLGFAYYVAFTGYCGQTPGKMALRLKVILCNGENIGYGRAAIREIPAKFIAGIVLCIGYLMIAFDRQKQGLHDHMVKTYVVKL